MEKSLRVGLGFGLASGTITTLGLMIGLEAGTSSRIAVLSGIITIAIADAFSDALGVHIAKESEGNFTLREIWRATIVTLLSKMVFAGTFLIPVLLWPLEQAVVVAVIWGIIILLVQSFFLAKTNGQKVWPIILEHLLIAFLVIFSTHYLGRFLNTLFN
ncbi:MAG: hypothetical protein WC456_04500 [Patescibacteria group bacterium]